MIRALFIVSLCLTLVSCMPSAAVKRPVLKSDSYYSYATWYGPGFNGKKAADGSIYDQHGLTCAHPSFPFGTYLEVMNIANGKKIIVKVTDRPGNDVLDLTEKAFVSIALKAEGKIKVRIKPVETSMLVNRSVKSEKSSKKSKSGKVVSSKKSDDYFYTIQLAAFKNADAAKDFMDSTNINAVYIYFEQGTVDIYRVRVGRFTSRKDALKYKSLNLPGKESIVVKVRD